MIELRDIHKTFAGNHVLRGIDLSVARGQSLVLIGGSGSGKSVILKSILGLLHPESGDILIDGKNVARKPRRQRLDSDRKIGMLFQNGALFDSLSVWENVVFAARQKWPQLNRSKLRDLAAENLNKVGLPDYMIDHMPDQLAGGAHKRVGLARAIAAKPDIIFFDEPTTGLDSIMTDIINHLIRDCVSDLGATTITITHDMSSVRVIADKAAFLYQGKIIWQGDEADFSKSDNAYLHQFINGLADGPIEVEGRN